jgi:glyoxylase I family protein
VTSIHHLALTARDLADSLPFYDGLLQRLGYQKVLDTPQVAAWELDGETEILVYQAKPEEKKYSHRIYQPGFHHLAFKVDEREIVDIIYEWLTAAKVEILDAPRTYPDYPGNYYAIFFLDPNGLKFEVMHN